MLRRTASSCENAAQPRLTASSMLTSPIRNVFEVVSTPATRNPASDRRMGVVAASMTGS